MARTIPATLEECTPGWLTETLRSTGAITPDAEIVGRSIEVLGSGQGFMCELGRLTLDYGSGSGPASLVAKLPTRVPDNRKGGEIAGVYERELRMYRQLLPHLPVDIPHPRLYYADIEDNPEAEGAMERIRRLDRLPIWALRLVVALTARFGRPDTFASVLLVEDLTPPLSIGDQVAGCDIERAAAAIDVIAALHATTWGAAAPPESHWIVPIDLAPRLGRAVVARGRRKFLRGFGHLLSPHARDVFRGSVRRLVPLTRDLAARSPRCLLHGDYRLDNMFFDGEGRIAAVIDWQTASLGPGVTDIAYFLCGSLDPAVPEADIDGLLAHYHQRLVDAGVDDYSLEQLRRDYDDMLVLLLARMAGVDLLDFGESDGRGADLVTQWIRRLDARVARLER